MIKRALAIMARYAEPAQSSGTLPSGEINRRNGHSKTSPADQAGPPTGSGHQDERSHASAVQPIAVGLLQNGVNAEELPALLPVNGMDPTGKSPSTVMDCFSTSDNVHPVADDGTPGNNQAQNPQLNAVVKILGLNHIQRRALHLEITGQNYSYKQIMQAAKDMFGK